MHATVGAAGPLNTCSGHVLLTPSAQDACDKHPHLAYYVGIAPLKNRSAKISCYPLSRSPLFSIFRVPLILLQCHCTHVHTAHMHTLTQSGKRFTKNGTRKQVNQRNLLSKVLAQNAQHAKLFCIGRWKTKAQAKCVRKSILRKRLHHHLAIMSKKILSAWMTSVSHIRTCLPT